MKKLIVVLAALAVVVAFSAPAFAGATLHVRALTDVGYRFLSKERNVSGKQLTTVFCNIPSHSYLKGLYISDDKKVGAHAEFSIKAVSHTNAVGLRYLYGWYKVGNCKLVAGQTDGWFGSLAFAPFQHLGLNYGKLLLLGWGLVYSDRFPQVRFEWESGGMGFSIAIVEPGASVGFFDATGTALGAPYATFPRFDLALKFVAGGFLTMPGFSFSQRKVQYPDGLPNFQEEVTTWCAWLPVKFTAGAFTVKAQGFYGINMGYEYTLFSTEVIAQSGNDFEDTTSYGGNLAVEYKIGAMTLAAGGGVVYSKNDAWGPARDNTTRYMGFVSGRYQVTPNFYVHPEFSYYDYGKSIADDRTMGNEMLLGMQIGFIF